jgi:glycosyltransferase involved in cell wall biosynthesis
MYNQYPLVNPGIKNNIYNSFFYYLLNIRTITPVLNKASIEPNINISETPEDYRRRLLNYSNTNFKNRSIWFPFGGSDNVFRINKEAPTQGINILSIGKFEKRKNMDKAISVLNKISISQNKKLNFTVIGEYDVSKKSYFDYLNKLAKKYNTDSFQVSVIVNMSRDNLREEFLKTHYFVLLSEEEIASYSQLEAFLYGCKVIVFYDNGFLNFLPNNSNYKILYRKEHLFQDLNSVIFNNEITNYYEYVAEYLKLFNSVSLANKLISFFK